MSAAHGAMPAGTTASLQDRLGHVFRDPRLMERALTHRSAGAEHNERLEFLGDAVLGAAVSALLFARHTEAAEGDLTRVRAHLVREATLHGIALDLGLPALMRLSEGEARGGGAQRPSILADAFEALIGAVHVDAGFAAAAAVVQRCLASRLTAGTDAAVWRKDAKTALQEWLQARRLPVPGYELTEVSGPGHEQHFVVSCEVPAHDLRVSGRGRSRRAAEQAAAQEALNRLQGGTR